MYKRYLTYILFLSFLFSHAQDIAEKGIPFIKNYLPEDYGNHGKIWEIKSAQNGLVYMASENGLLEFDGKKWNRFRDYKGYTRSLFLMNDSTIYTGADMDFGVWKKNKYQKFNYQSLYPYNRKIGGVNEEFWGTYAYKDQIIFVSHQNLYQYSHQKITKIPAPVRFSESFQVKGRIFLADEKKGLYEYVNHQLVLLFAYPHDKNLEISGVFIDANNQLKIVTKSSGIYQFQNGNLQPLSLEISAEIIKNKVFSFTDFDGKYWAFGTILNGLYITDFNGKIIQHINKNKGLPNNTILSLHYQKNGKIWMGLDYGLSYSDIKNNITYFYNTNSDFGTGYTAALQDSTFYLGTNQGLYSAPWDALDNRKDINPFSIINGAEGQVWTLQKVGDKILCGHDAGLFEIDNYQLKKIYNEPGVMSILLYDENTLLTGNYNGISIFKKENNSWKFVKKMKFILGAINQIVKENHQILWVNIPNYGFIRFKVDEHFNPIKRTIINPKIFKGYFPYLFKDDLGMHVITNKAEYLYDSRKNSFSVFKNQMNFVEVNNRFTGFYQPISLDSNYGFYAINNGFALEKKLNSSKKNLFFSELLFRKIQAFNNQEVLDFHEGSELPFRFNNVRFSFLQPHETSVQYQYYLEGFSEDWSAFSDKGDIEFLGLKEGDYILFVKARKGNQISSVKNLHFTIKAPWYRTYSSYFVYAVLLYLGFLGLRKIHLKRLAKQRQLFLEKEKKSLEEQAEKHRQEMLLEKQKQLELEQNKLKEEIKNKTIELATKAKDDDDKIRVLKSISEKIAEAEQNPNILKLKIGEIRRLVHNRLETNDQTFEIQMDELHQEFFKAMKKRFPSLSIYDLRLCAYLKIGLNSKEMAEIFQVLPSSINVSRSRLRKKLNLSPEEDLYEFLNSVE